MCQPIPGGTAYDLGCGPGNLTVDLHRETKAGTTVGWDTSETMLGRTAEHASDDIQFQLGDLGSFTANQPADLIFANASLHWVNDHAAVIGRWRSQLAPGGQLAIQVPTNSDHPAYVAATQVAEHFADWFPGGVPPLVTSSVEAPETYAQILYDLKAEDLWVAMRVFCHSLPSTSEIVEWVKGTALTRYRVALDDDERYEQFLEMYTNLLFDRLGQKEPYLFTFKRILMWSQFD